MRWSMTVNLRVQSHAQAAAFAAFMAKAEAEKKAAAATKQLDSTNPAKLSAANAGR